MSSSLIRATALVAFALISAGASAQQRPVNDTGVISCTNESWGAVACETVNANLPGQDATLGRDALALTGALTKIGSGRRGFDLTKLDSVGGALPGDANYGYNAGQYLCVRDNTTGLVWRAAYAVTGWRDANPATNGGFIGAENPGGTTDSYAAAENAANRCNRTTWRLPTVRELLSIATFEAASSVGYGDPMVAVHPTAITWTSQSNPAYPEHAVVVAFGHSESPAVISKMQGQTNKPGSQVTILVSSQ